MEKFEFKSAICTSVEQSKRLLALGLKKETADCHWFYHNEHWGIKIGFDLISCENLYPKYYIPAWSLHRLMEIAEANDIAFLDISKMYNTCIKIIEGRIYAGLINKDYLEEKK